MPLVVGQTTAITSPTTLTIAAGAIEGGICEVLLAVTSTLALPTTYPGIPAGKGVVVNGSVTPGFNYRIVVGISAGDLVIFCFQQSAILVVPGQVTGLTLGAPTNTTQPLTWTAPASNGGTALTDYLIEYKLAAAGTYTTLAHAASTVTAIVVTGLTASQSYNYQVSAVNSVGTGPASTVATGSTTAVTLALDSITTAPIGAYSLNRKLRSAYAGSACIIRSSAGGNITVGFSGNTVDWPTAMTALGANNAFLVTVFDQSANGRDATQAGVGQQPQIASAGVVNKQASLYPASIGNSGANSGLATAGFTLGATLGGATIYAAAGLLTNAGAFGVATLLAGADANDYDSTNSLYVANNALTLTSFFGTFNGQAATITSAATIVTCSRYTPAGTGETWVNGIAGAGGSNGCGAVGTAGAGNRLSFHGRIQGGAVAQPSAGNVMEIIYFPRLVDVDRLAVENNLRTAYGV